MGFGSDKAPEVTQPVPVAEESLATDQEAVPVPWFWGRRKIAGRWICRARARMAVEAQNARPGKK